MRLSVVLAAAAATLAACGSSDDAAAPAAPDVGTTTATAGQECQDVRVTGHIATELRAEGLPCSQAAEVAAAALGKGRAPYEAAGLACEPADAGGGDTRYTCTGQDARLTFRYGTA